MVYRAIALSLSTQTHCLTLVNNSVQWTAFEPYREVHRVSYREVSQGTFEQFSFNRLLSCFLHHKAIIIPAQVEKLKKHVAATVSEIKLR